MASLFEIKEVGMRSAYRYSYALSSLLVGTLVHSSEPVCSVNSFSNVVPNAQYHTLVQSQGMWLIGRRQMLMKLRVCFVVDPTGKST